MKHFMQPKSSILRENQDPPLSSSTKHRSHNRKQKISKENAPPPDSNSICDFSASPVGGSGKLSPAVAKLKSPLPPRPPKNSKKLNLDIVLDNVGTIGSSDSGVQVIVRMRPPNMDEEEGELIVQKNSADSLSIVGQTFTFDSVADFNSTQMDIFQLVGAPLVENCLAGFNSSVFAYGQTGSGKTYTIWGPSNALLEENLSSDQQGLTPRVFERLFARIDEEQAKHADKQLRYQCRCSFLEIYNEQITDLLDPTQRNLQIREDVKTGVYVENLREECVCTMKDVTKLLMKGLSNRRIGATSINTESSRSHSVFTCVVESRCKGVADGLSCFKSSRINLVDLAGSERQKLTGAAGDRLKEAGNINRSLSQLGNLINILAEVSQTGKQRHIPYRDSKLTFLLQESLGGNAKLAMVCAISPAQSCKSETLGTLRFAQRAKAVKNKAVVNEEMQDDVNVLREVIRQLKDELYRVKQMGNCMEPNGGYSTGWNARRSLNLLKFSLNRPMTLPHIDDEGDEEMEIVEQAEQIGLLLAGIEGSNSGDGKKLEMVQVVDSKQLDSRKGHKILSPRVSMEPVTGNDSIEEMELKTESKMEIKESEKILSEIDSGEPSGSKNSAANMEELKFDKTSEEKLTQSSQTSENIFPCQPDALYISDTVSKIADEKSLRNSAMNILSPSLSQLSADDVIDPVLNPSISSDKCANPSDFNIVTSEVFPVLDSRSPTDANGSPPDSSDDSANPSDISIVTCSPLPVLKSPTPTVSPIPSNSRSSSSTSISQKDLSKSSLTPETIRLSFAKPSKSTCFNAQTTRIGRSVNQPSEQLAASLQRGLDILDNNRQNSGLRRSSFRFSYRPADIKPLLVHKVDVGVQTQSHDDETTDADPVAFLCSKCKVRDSVEDYEDANENSDLQLVAVEDWSQTDEKPMKQVPKAVEKVLAGAFRREMALEEYCAKQSSEIMQLNRLVQQFKHERECNAIIGQTREDKIGRLESLMDGILSTEDFLEDELVSLKDENKILKDKYENHPELLSTKIELQRVRDELERYQNFHDMGERDVLVEEIQDLRTQLKYYTETSHNSIMKRSSVRQLHHSREPCIGPSSCSIPESSEDDAEKKLKIERMHWTEAESKWISLAEELRVELEANRMLAEKQKEELNIEKKCSEELKVSMQMAMEGHARMIEQYADLQEKHIQLLDRHRRIRDGIDDVKKAASRAGVRGTESKFINTLAAEISALKVEREKERRYLMDENRGLQIQLRDTAEAVQAAGELLVRLKEAEEAVATAQNQAAEAEIETEKAYKQIDKLKRKHERDIRAWKQLLAESRLPKEAIEPVYDDCNTTKYDGVEPDTTADQHWRDEFKPFYISEEESTRLAEPSWFSGYDRCNV
ncbi:kinesin-like protein KIN-12B [Apium graveolens]|uniref:kinesin-like protein KIN-12B n=1 Tax=Apium graveolens TaxID=4045 RepID=UPI003D7AD358